MADYETRRAELYARIEALKRAADAYGEEPVGVHPVAAMDALRNVAREGSAADVAEVAYELITATDELGMTVAERDTIEKAARVLFDNNHLTPTDWADARVLVERLAAEGLLATRPVTREAIAWQVALAMDRSWSNETEYADLPTVAADAVLALLHQAPECHCSPCPGRGTDGHGMAHCAECCFGSGVEVSIECPVHGEAPERDVEVSNE